MTSTKQQPTRAHTRLRDLALYIAIAFGVGMAAIGFARTNISHDMFIRWGGLIVNTLVLFGYFIADSRPLWRKQSFWVLTSTFLFVHVAVFAAILTQVSQWKLIWFLVMYLEVPVLAFARSRFLTTDDSRSVPK